MEHAMFDSAENAYSMIFRKIFKVNDKANIQLCQYYCNQLPVELKIGSRKIQFLDNLTNCNNSILRWLGKLDKERRTILRNKYGITFETKCIKYYVLKYFKSKIVM